MPELSRKLTQYRVTLEALAQNGKQLDGSRYVYVRAIDPIGALQTAVHFELLRDPQVLALRYQAAEPYARRSGSHRDAKVFDAQPGISEWYVPGKDWWITRPRP